MRLESRACAIALALVIGLPAVSSAEDPPQGLREDYEETPGMHSERPGKHSTTAGNSASIRISKASLWSINC